MGRGGWRSSKEDFWWKRWITEGVTAVVTRVPG
jgi:hypothetical protein